MDESGAGDDGSWAAPDAPSGGPAAWVAPDTAAAPTAPPAASFAPPASAAGPASGPAAGEDLEGPPDPMPVPLRPMTTGDALDGAFALLRSRPKTVLGIAAIFMVPLQFVAAFLQRDVLGGESLSTAMNDPSVAFASNDSAAATNAAAFVLLIGGSLLLSFVTGSYARLLAAWYAGSSISTGEALKASLRRTWPLSAAWLLVHLVELPGACVGFGAFFIAPLFLVVAPAIVVEQLGPIEGIRRAWQIGTKRYIPALLLVLGSGAVAYLLGQALNAVPTLLGTVVGLDIGWLIVAVGGSLSGIVATVAVAGATALFYIDARVRLEGLDLELAAADALPRA